MPLVHEVPIEPRPVESFIDILGSENVERMRDAAARLRRRLDGRTIWNINSTAAGGGVAEMLHTLLAYARGAGVNTRWLVIGGNPDFFRITKRLHNALHGEAGDGSELDGRAAKTYEQVIAQNASELNDHIKPGDVVIFHDPQTAGLIPGLVARDIAAIWRCHIGNDVPTDEGDQAWRFLAPYLVKAHAFVFSRFSYLPDVLYHGRCLIAPPTIDPFSPKNQHMSAESVRAIMVRLGLITGSEGNGSRHFTQSDGTRSTVNRPAEVIREGGPPSPDTPLVVQVSRWDRLKDPVGVLRGFNRAMEVPSSNGANLVLAGPSMAAVADDPEGAAVYDEVVEVWKALPEEQRKRVHLVNLPMDDLQENAAMVNAIQRHAAVVVQKSLREGFGLTVTEAMWKARPVIGSAVGGITDQIEHGVSGLLLKRPDDEEAFAGSLGQLLRNRGFAERLGRNARRRVSQNYLGLSILTHYEDLVERLEHDLPDNPAPVDRRN